MTDTSFKKTWQVIKEALGKVQVNRQVFPNEIIVNKNNITSIEFIAINFNNFFTEIGLNSAKSISSKFCLQSIWMNTWLAVTFFNQKKQFQLINSKEHSSLYKKAGDDDINFDVVKEMFLEFLIFPLYAVFFQKIWRYSKL